MGKLWSPDGEVLTSVAFSNESTSGWQTADLASPIRISGGKSYTVSYRAPYGRYADDQWVFSNGRTIKKVLLARSAGFTPTDQDVRLLSGMTRYYVDVKFVDTQAGADHSTTPR